MPRTFGRSFLVVGLVLAGGCGVRVAKYDVSPPGQDDHRGYHGRLIKLEDGLTRRADLERLLGRPELVEEGGRLAAYRWQRIRFEAYALALLGDDDEPVAQPTAVLYASLLLEFDDAGVLRRHRKVRHRVAYGAPPALPDLLAAWQDEMAAR